MSKKIRFISIEGGEGSGKSTVIRAMKEFLESLGYKVIVTREPGGLPNVERLREVMLNESFEIEGQMYLFGVCRLEHLRKKIIPALNDDFIVICDRYIDSSLVYQGYEGGLGVETVWNFNKSLVGSYIPDKTFYLNVEVEEGLRRIFTNDEREKTLYDMKTVDYHKRIKEGYDKLIGSVYDNGRIIEINANLNEEEVKQLVLNELNELFL